MTGPGAAGPPTDGGGDDGEHHDLDEPAILALVAEDPESLGPEVVRAGGGLVVRGAVAGDGTDRREVAVVHRPRYDDWSLPKGKLEKGEAWADGAHREVWEETGLRCEVGAEIARVAYRDRKRRPKVVRYWQMTPIDGAFEPNDEVDELRWVGLDEAAVLLTYPHDRRVPGLLVD